MSENKSINIADKILSGLKKRYKNIGTLLKYRNPWELLVAVQLAAQCTDARVNLVTPEFFRLWPTPKALVAASINEIEEVIKSTGFYHNKAKNLLACARILENEYAGNVPAKMAELIKLPGVARKTANCILYGAFNINEGLAVDTHVKRIAYRLGLTAHFDPIKIEKDLMTIFPQEEWGNVNFRMVEFGRDVCRAKKPACNECEFLSFCPKLSPPADQQRKRANK